MPREKRDLGRGRLTLTEAAEAIGCSRQQIYRLIDRGEIEVRETADGKPYVRESDVSALASRYTPTKGRPPAAKSPGFGAEVERLRKARGWSQDDAAEACGMDRTTISAIERGEWDVRLSHIEAILRGFGVSLRPDMTFTEDS